MQERVLTYKKISLYLILFFVVWSIRELVIQPVFISPLDDIAAAIIGQTIKLLVWTLPAVLLIRYFHNDMWIGLKEMFTTKPQWFKEAPILLLVFLPFAQSLVHNGTIAIHPDFVPSSLIGAVVFVGITEELVFRGFLLNVFLKRMKMQYAVALDAVLFLFIHYPIWIYRGLAISEIWAASLVVPFISAFFAYSFIKTRNIFVPIVLHMIWNLLTIILFGSS